VALTGSIVLALLFPACWVSNCEIESQTFTKYETLDASAHEIRFIKLLPGSESDEIKCTHSALSYSTMSRHTRLYLTFRVILVLEYL
jgi:hypothetical protein